MIARLDYSFRQFVAVAGVDVAVNDANGDDCVQLNKLFL